PAPISFRGVRTSEDGPALKVTVRGVQSRGGGAAHVLVSLEPLEEAVPAARTETEIDLDQVSRQQMAALESELGHTKENLQAAIEELEASNEELQASNEELQASNEE